MKPSVAMNGDLRTRWIGLIVAAAALALPACSTRYTTNQTIAPSYVAAQARQAPATALDPNERLFLDPVTLTAVPAE